MNDNTTKIQELLEVVRAWINRDKKYWGLSVTESYGDTNVTWYEDTDCCDLRNTIKIPDITKGDAWYYDAGMFEEIFFNIYEDLDKLHSIIEENSEPCFTR